MNATAWPRLALFGLVLVACAAPANANWPQWRGPNNDGVATDKNLPAEWSATKNVAWKLKMPGMGGATPCIWGDRIFVTSEDGDHIVLLCISTQGKQLWKQPIGKTTRKARFDEGNGASASPCTDGKHVYVFAGDGTFAAFDFAGKPVWTFDAQKRYGRFRIQFGIHITPVLHGDRLYWSLIHDGGGFVMAIDKHTGKDVWKVERPSDGRAECLHSYASPFLWTDGRQAYLVVHGNDYATAHDLKDGKEIWRVGGLNPKERYNFTLRFVASPLCTPGLIVIPSAKNGPVVALRPDARGQVNAGSKHELWRMDRGTPDVPCPLLHDGIVYLCRENGELIAAEAQSGKQLYRQRTHAHRHRASPVYADGKVYLTARDGTCTVVQAGKEFKKLATNKLPDQTAASPAVAGGRLYVRGFEYLWCIEKK